MNLRIYVTYPATDGSMPESVELEWTDVTDDGVMATAMLERLLAAPGKRLEKEALGRMERTVASPGLRAGWVDLYTAAQDIPQGMRVREQDGRLMRAAEMETGGVGIAGETLSIGDRLVYEVTANPGDRIWRKAK